MTKPRGTDNARVIQVIETTALLGEGSEKDPCRRVTQYWNFDGKLLATNDPCVKEKKSRSSPYIPSCGRGGARRMKDDGRDKRLDILTLIVAIIALVKACC